MAEQGSGEAATSVWRAGLMRAGLGLGMITAGTGVMIDAAEAQAAPAPVILEDNLLTVDASATCEGVTVSLSADPSTPDSLGLQIDHEDDTDIDETLTLGGANPDSALIPRFDSDASTFVRIWDAAFSGDILVDYADCDVDPTTSSTTSTTAASSTTSTTVAVTTSTTDAPATTSTTAAPATTSTTAAPAPSTTEAAPVTPTSEYVAPSSTAQAEATSTTAAAAEGEELPRTGNETAAQAAAGLILIVGGSALVAAGRRRAVA